MHRFKVYGFFHETSWRSLMGTRFQVKLVLEVIPLKVLIKN